MKTPLRNALRSLIKGIQGNFDHLQGELEQLAEAHNAVVDGIDGVQEYLTTGGGVGGTGAAGAAGADGEPGEDGRPGPPGPAGPPGDDGAPGPPGRMGVDGAQGPAGQAGPPGVPIAGWDGEDGMTFVIPGARGATGADGVGVNGAPGTPGFPGDEGEPGSWTPGPRGATGATGSQGPQGDPGATGATGPSGPVGFPGADGEDAQFFLPGPRGAQGTQGIQGNPGADGAGGAAGPPAMFYLPEDAPAMGVPGRAAAPTASTTEVDLGSTAVLRGSFTITDGTIDASKQVLIWQAPGPYTNKGTRADEADMVRLDCRAVAGAGSATVTWETMPILTRPLWQNATRNNYEGVDGTATTDTIRVDLERRPVVQRINKVRGYVKFNYMVLG